MKKKRINYSKYFSLFFAIAVLVFITGCTGASPTTPIINSFLANPTTVTVGESSTLSWSVTDATSVTIDNAIGSVALTGATAVNPTTTTAYTLTATNTAGSVTATTTVTVSSALTVTYDGNGNTAGTVPVDPSSPYQSGATVTVMGNAGDLTRIHSGGTSYYFSGWNTQADGSGVDQAEGSTFTMGGSPVTFYAQWTPYVLRDIGPAGGYIFYDKGSYSDSWRYLEAAPSDQSASAPWGCYGVSISGADGTAVGTGEQNTLDIEAGCATPGTPADICVNLSLGGYSDWFLPSKDELNLMYTNLKVHEVGGFADDYYWSSSEYGAYDDAWAQNCLNGLQFSDSKDYAYRVRAVRAF